MTEKQKKLYPHGERIEDNHSKKSWWWMECLADAQNAGLNFFSLEYFVYYQIRVYETHGDYKFCIAGADRLAEDLTFATGVEITPEQVREALRSLRSKKKLWHIFANKRVYRNKTKFDVTLQWCAERHINPAIYAIGARGKLPEKMLGETCKTGAVATEPVCAATESVPAPTDSPLLNKSQNEFNNNSDLTREKNMSSLRSDSSSCAGAHESQTLLLQQASESVTGIKTNGKAEANLPLEEDGAFGARRASPAPTPQVPPTPRPLAAPAPAAPAPAAPFAAATTAENLDLAETTRRGRFAVASQLLASLAPLFGEDPVRVRSRSILVGRAKQLLLKYTEDEIASAANGYLTADWIQSDRRTLYNFLSEKVIELCLPSKVAVASATGATSTKVEWWMAYPELTTEQLDAEIERYFTHQPFLYLAEGAFGDINDENSFLRKVSSQLWSPYTIEKRTAWDKKRGKI